MALIEVLDGKLHAFELILALHGVGAGPRNGGADRDRVPLRSVRPGAERRLVFGECGQDQSGRQQRAPGEPRAGPEQAPPRQRPKVISIEIAGHENSSRIV